LIAEIKLKQCNCDPGKNKYLHIKNHNNEILIRCYFISLINTTRIQNNIFFLFTNFVSVNLLKIPDAQFNPRACCTQIFIYQTS